MNIIKELRKKKGIQQKELAIEIGVSCPTVSEWESGKKDPSGDRLKKLSEYFGVDELMILGVGVHSNKVRIPITEEAQIICGGIDIMPKQQRKHFLSVAKAMSPDIFIEKDK